jgi:predicted Rdx family selenoprotein
VNVPAVHDASDIAAVVERARALLDEGDVIAARLLAAGAYDQAKAAAAFGARFDAAARLVEKARRLQGDALLIEARAKVRIADEYDAAQAAGQVGVKGQRTDLVPDGNKVPTADDVGLSRKEVHEARKLRDAERRTPGIVERAIAARLAAGLEPSRANLRATIGTRSATREERGDNFYATPPEATRTLLALESFAPLVWEPACGKGAISQLLEDAGYELILSDLVDRGATTRHGECQEVGDFLQTDRRSGEPDIVTNPPYGAVLNAFVAHALRVHRPRKMALLLNLNFLCGFEDPERCFVMDECPPARIHVFTRRLPMMHRDGWEGPHASSSMNTAWFVWERDADGGYAGPTIVNRVDWKDFEDVAALRPGTVPVSPPLPDEGSDSAPCGLRPLVWECLHEGGRRLAKAGKLEVGVVFPPDRDGGQWSWTCFLGVPTGTARHRKCATEEKGKQAVEKAYRAMLSGESG